MPKLSVIVPVYNVENYLKRCLDSLINQTLQDIEIICINDCSTDRSLDILKDYASKDKRINIIDLSQNHGVSFARNKGIESANGDFTAFLDPDDWWELDFAQKTLSKICKDDADIVLFAHNQFLDDKFTKDRILYQIKDVIDRKNYKEHFCDFVNFVWDKVYRTSLIKDKNIKFPLNIHPTEDVIFALDCFSYNPKMSYLPECLYNYQKDRENSAMKKYDKLVINQIEAAYIMFNSNFYKNADSEYKKLCLKKIIGGIVYFCFLILGKKYSITPYMQEITKFIEYIKKELPDEFITGIAEIRTLINFISVKQNKKIMHGSC